MTTRKPRTTAPPRDDVDRATDRLRRAADDLVRLMGHPHGDSEVDPRAARALMALGPYAVEPLAAGLRHARGLHHRCLILILIIQLGTRSTPELDRILSRVVRRDPDERVRSLAADALFKLSLREESATREAEKRRAAEEDTTTEPLRFPDGCSPALARRILEGEVNPAIYRV